MGNQSTHGKAAHLGSSNVYLQMKSSISHLTNELLHKPQYVWNKCKFCNYNYILQLIYQVKNTNTSNCDLISGMRSHNPSSQFLKFGLVTQHQGTALVGWGSSSAAGTAQACVRPRAPSLAVQNRRAKAHVTKRDEGRRPQLGGRQDRHSRPVSCELCEAFPPVDTLCICFHKHKATNTHCSVFIRETTRTFGR